MADRRRLHDPMVHIGYRVVPAVFFLLMAVAVYGMLRDGAPVWMGLVAAAIPAGGSLLLARTFWRTRPLYASSTHLLVGSGPGARQIPFPDVAAIDSPLVGLQPPPRRPPAHPARRLPRPLLPHPRGRSLPAQPGALGRSSPRAGDERPGRRDPSLPDEWRPRRAPAVAPISVRRTQHVAAPVREGRMFSGGSGGLARGVHMLPTTETAGVQGLYQLSPFELKDELIRLARDNAQNKGQTARCSTPGGATRTGSPPRPARRSSCWATSPSPSPSGSGTRRDLGGMPGRRASPAGFDTFLAPARSEPGADLLARALDYGVDRARLRRGRLRPRTGRLASSATTTRCRPHAGARRADRPRATCSDEMCDDRPPPGTLRPVRHRRRHRGHVLHLRLADGERHPQAGRHDRPR